MSGMVERVAIAICRQETEMYARDHGVDISTLPDPAQTGKTKSYEGAARAVIAAMREPTEAMIYAGNAAPGDGEYEASVIWCEMIDAALK